MLRLLNIFTIQISPLLFFPHFKLAIFFSTPVQLNLHWCVCSRQNEEQRFLIRRPGPAEGHIMKHYTFLLTLTYILGFTIEKNSKYLQFELILCKVFLNLTFVYPCIVSIIVNDDQQDATILGYLFIYQLYMFRGMFSQIIGRTWLYLQLLILSTVMINFTNL